MSATAFGMVLGFGALGAAAGALAAPSLAAGYGPGPMMLAALTITPLTQLPLLLASPGLAWQFAIAGALFLQLACAAAAGTTQRTIRQVITADGMQARMQAVSTWLTSGARPVAALLAGGLGTSIGVRPTLTVGTCLLVVPLVVLYRSPLRSLLDMPGSPTAASPPAEPSHLRRRQGRSSRIPQSPWMCGTTALRKAAREYEPGHGPWPGAVIGGPAVGRVPPAQHLLLALQRPR